MNDFIKSAVIKTLKNIIDKIESNTCELTEEQAMHIISTLSHEVLSKDQACSYLNLSRSRFDELVRQGKLPKGKKRRGFKELVWYKDEINNAIKI